MRIADGKPIEGEGHKPSHSKLLLGIVPWAPIAAGAVAMEKYHDRVVRLCGGTDGTGYALIKGFRYLVQDKPEGTMLQPSFVEGLHWLAEHDYTFDLGIDFRSGGVWQIREACTLLQQLAQNAPQLRIIVNHFCKPNFRVSVDEVNLNEDFAVWKESMKLLASYPNAYIKLSGFFSELPLQDEDTPTPIKELLKQVKPWVDVVFSVFGPQRIMFGSDWPVCSAAGLGRRAWQHWVDLVALILDERALGSEDRLRVWSGTAVEAYRINLP